MLGRPNRVTLCRDARVGMDRFQLDGSSAGVMTVSQNDLYKFTNPVYVGDLPFIGLLFAESSPLHFLLYSIRAEWVFTSV